MSDLCSEEYNDRPSADKILNERRIYFKYEDDIYFDPIVLKINSDEFFEGLEKSRSIFINIIRGKIERYEAYETLKLKIKNFVRDYEERMEKMLEFCGNETELMNQHSIIGNHIKKEMLKYNPFNDFALIEPYLIKLEVELKKTFNTILKVKSDQQTLELQNVIRDA
jgi:hypothetical protein